MAKGKACFLDRDGVVIEEEDYISDPGRVRLCAGAVEALKKLKQSGYLLIVVSNQSGVARGKFPMRAVEAVQARIDKLLKAQGVIIDAWYNCPHHPSGSVTEFAIDCDCRKPKPGMLLKAEKEHFIDLSKSLMIGDKVSDIEAGFNAGCRFAAMVMTGHGSEQKRDASILKRAIIADNILDATAKLLSKAQGRPLDISPAAP